MNEIEAYALGLVYQGAAHCAQDDLNEDDEPLEDEDWRAACTLGRDIALVIEGNQESFLAWYRQTGR